MVCTPEDDWCFYFPLGSGWVTPCKDQGTSFVKRWAALASDWLQYSITASDWPIKVWISSLKALLSFFTEERTTSQQYKNHYFDEMYSAIFCICIYFLKTRDILQNCWHTPGQRTPLTAFTRKVIETRNVGHWNVKANLAENQSLVVNFIIKSNTRKCYYWERLIKNEWSKCRHKLT